MRWAIGNIAFGTPENKIRNNSMRSASVPSTAPALWGGVDGLSSAFNGITTTIDTVGVESGIEFIDLRLVGTATATTSAFIRFEGTQQIIGSPGQTLTLSCYTKLAAGALTNATVGLFIGERDAAGANLVSSSTTIVPTAALIRFSFSRTLNNSGTRFVLPALFVGITNTQAIDLTLRVGWPQLVRSTAPCPVVRTSVGAARGPRMSAGV